MQLRRFGCTGYKAFKKQTVIDVRPLTLFIGRNNSGKSSLLRLARLLLRALSSYAPKNSFPLEVDSVIYGQNFRDLVHGRATHGAVQFSVELEGDGNESLELDAKVQTVIEGRTGDESAIVSEWTLKSPTPRSLVWERVPGAIPSYRGEGPILFRGLLPEIREKWAFLEPWRVQIDSFEEHCSHLGPVRAAARPTYEKVSSRSPMVDFASLGLTGEGAVGCLWRDRDLREETATWFEKHLDGWRLGLDQAGSTYQCTLSRGLITVNLSDSGQGMQQVLPVVVQQLLLKKETLPFLCLVEQPELHLHSAAQAPLADLLLDNAGRQQGTILVETHSENLILRVRRRIAEGRFPPDSVALYFVDENEEGYSSLKRIRIDDKGEVDSWPVGVFSEGYEEIKALRKAARAIQGREV